MSANSVRNVTPPNYPVAPLRYDPRFQDQFISVLRLFSNSVSNAINAPKVFGSFYSTVDQTNPVANVVRLMTTNDIISTYGCTRGNTASRIYVAETAVYNIQFSAQLSKSSGSSPQPVYIWLRINGTDVPYSASQVNLKDASSETVAAWNFVVILESNSYFELAWLSPDTNMYLKAPATPATSVPAIPSVIITVTSVSNIPV